VTGNPPDPDRFMALAARLQQQDPRLSGVQAGMVVALDLGIAKDSRSFSRLFGIEHSIVLRELTDIPGAWLQVTSKDERTLRTFYRRDNEGAAAPVT
jgi:hypothetical protein